LNNSWHPSSADLHAFDAIKVQKLGVPKATCHARVFAWYSLVSRFSEDARKRWEEGNVKASEPVKESNPQPITKKPVVEETKHETTASFPPTIREYYEDSYRVSL